MASNKRKIDREPNWSFEEVKILSQFVREHTAQLCGTRNKSTAEVDHVKEIHWRKFAEVLRACGGKERDWLKIRKKWQDISSQARAYYRNCNKTGGGSKPPTNPSLEVVLDALQPVAKDGVLSKDEGETRPDVQIALEAVAQDISQQLEVEMEGMEGVDLEEEDDEEEGHAESGPSNVKSVGATKTTRRQDSILQIERERLVVEKEQLEVSKAMAESLKDISHTFQQFLSITLHQSGLHIVQDPEV